MRNNDAAGELEELREMLKHSKHFVSKNYSTREIVEIAINELYDALVRERTEGGQR